MGLRAGAIERDGQPKNAGQHEQLGGARAGFAANLGKSVAELQSVLVQWSATPDSPRLAEDMQRRVRALASGARLLRFTALAEELAACEHCLEGIREQGSLSEDHFKSLRAMFDGLPKLAWSAESGRPAAPRPAQKAISKREAGVVWNPWGDAALPRPKSRTKSSEAPRPDNTAAPLSVLVVGPESLTHALSANPHSHGARGFEVERAADHAVALDMARAVAPDVIVVDADVARAEELVDALLSDSLTEPVPVIVVGHWSKPEDAANYVALGVARALPKPVSPELLRQACADATASYGRREVRREPLGTMTLDQLGARLAEELRRGLCDAADARTRNVRMMLGEGTEVLGALWGAVARIRDVCTIAAAGEVRFDPRGPEGALPLAPWIGGPEGGSGRAPRSSEIRMQQATPTSLAKTVALVADDDAAITWFLAAALRAAGATVHEAQDGIRALELAHQVAPNLVISDVLMPRLDGFGLCRALKRDVALRDVPVILLSWKEDLLQRVRELGAHAEGYLRKESSSAAIVQRVREVMRPQRRVIERLSEGGEVKGRLEGLTSRTLLKLTCDSRPDSILTVRDATFLYEVHIREGRPVRATRTAVEGTFLCGPAVLASLLGVGAGRFVVSPYSSKEASFGPELQGSLSEQLAMPIASARAAQRLLSGADLVRVTRVGMDQELLGAYVEATPDPARGLLRALTEGQSPRSMILSARAAARLLEDVLSDAAVHGGIVSVLSETGVDLLPEAKQKELEIIQGTRRSLPPPNVAPELLERPEFLFTAFPGPVAPSGTPLGGIEVAPIADIQVREEAPMANPPASDPPVAEDAALPQIGDDGAAALVGAEADSSDEIPVDVTDVPVRSRLVEEGLSAPFWPAREEHLGAKPSSAVVLGSLSPPPVMELAVTEESVAPPPAKVVAPAPRPPVRPVELERTPPRPMLRPSAYAPVSRPAPRNETKLTLWIVFAIAGVIFALVARFLREREIAPRPDVIVQPAAPPPAALPAVTATPSSEPTVTPESESVQDLPLRSDDKVAAGQGMLEIVAGVGNTVLVDGRLVGTGPVVKVPLAPRSEPYEVRVKLRGEDEVRHVLVKEGRLRRLRVAPPWSR